MHDLSGSECARWGADSHRREGVGQDGIGGASRQDDGTRCGSHTVHSLRYARCTHCGAVRLGSLRGWGTPLAARFLLLYGCMDDYSRGATAGHTVRRARRGRTRCGDCLAAWRGSQRCGGQADKWHLVALIHRWHLMRRQNPRVCKKCLALAVIGDVSL